MANDNIVLDRKKTFFVFSIVVVLTVVLLVVFNLSPKNDFIKTPYYNPEGTTISVPRIVGTEVDVPIQIGNEEMNYKTSAMWPRTLIVIAESITSKKKNGSDGKIFYYGDKIMMDQNRQVIEETFSGNFIYDNTGLLSEMFYPAYAQVFPVTVDAYKKLPVEVKYLLLDKSDVFCDAPIFSDIITGSSILIGDKPSDNFFNNYAWPNTGNCPPNFSMPRSPFTAEHSVAYANIDDDVKTPDHILIILDGSQYGGNGPNCISSPMILPIDADGDYYSLELFDVMPVCYAESLKKGEMLEITKITHQETSDGGLPAKETKESMLLESDAFVLYHENNQKTYLIYNKTASTQVKTVPGRQNVYVNESGNLIEEWY